MFFCWLIELWGDFKAEKWTFVVKHGQRFGLEDGEEEKEDNYVVQLYNNLNFCDILLVLDFDVEVTSE